VVVRQGRGRTLGLPLLAGSCTAGAPPTLIIITHHLSKGCARGVHRPAVRGPPALCAPDLASAENTIGHGACTAS